MTTYAFRRPYMATSGGLVQADSPREALCLVSAAYGGCYETTVTCFSEGKERTYELRDSKARRVQ